MMLRTRLSKFLIFPLLLMLGSVLVFSQYAQADTVVSLAGDKDSFGTGLPLGSPVIPAETIHDPWDGSFDQRQRSIFGWRHEYVLPEDIPIVGAILTVATLDVEDGGAGDGRGDRPFDVKLYLDGFELPGAFDDTYTPDGQEAVPPNFTIFVIDPEFFPLLEDGILDVLIDPFGGESEDHIWVDFAELQIEIGSPPESVPVLLDIKPSSCSNRLNVKSRGFLRVAIPGTEGFNVLDVDVGSIRLEGIPPLRSRVNDLTGPVMDIQDSWDCKPASSDGFDDLSLRFANQAIVTAIGDVSDGELIVMTLTGRLSDGTRFEGTDLIRIGKNGK
jgi:hypothetical protein